MVMLPATMHMASRCCLESTEPFIYDSTADAQDDACVVGTTLHMVSMPVRKKVTLIATSQPASFEAGRIAGTDKTVSPEEESSITLVMGTCAQPGKAILS